MIKSVNITDAFQKIGDYWNPRLAAELNGQHVKLVKFKGEFVWHKHDLEDEMFFVADGFFEMHFRDRIVTVAKNEFLVVPRGVEHKPVAREEVSVMLFEPAATRNTGNVTHELTRETLDKI